MVKRFPRYRPASTRLAALVTMLGLVASVLSLQAVSAVGADEDKLRDDKAKISKSLRNARGDLGHSSRQLLKAVRALEAAEGRLADARKKLDRTRVQLAAARERDRRMQTKLRAAVQRLEDARTELGEGAAEVDEQRAEVAEWAASSFQSNDSKMLGLRVLLKAQSAESLTTQMDAVDSVNDKNADRFDRLQATEVLLKVNKDEVEAAKKQIAKQRAAAADNLELKKSLTAEARAARDAVRSMVQERSKAKRAAERAKAADRRQIANLESERSRIEGQLAAIAERREAERRRQREAAARAAAQRASGGGGGGGASLNSGGFLAQPVNTYITSPYGMRYHPILHYNKLHDGTDFGGGCGTPIRAAASGRVLSKYYNAGYGNRVIIDHGVQKGESLSTSYNHLSSYSSYVGQRVQRGEIIGYVGTTGYSTGCHLHFMVYENGATVDPMGWL